jgi:hypothetical protein
VSSFAQTSTGDFDISTGNLKVSLNVAQCAAWKLSNLFGFAKGEWFRDLRQGFPFLQVVFVKNPNMNLLETLFSRVILMVKGVSSVTQMDLKLDARTRVLTARFKAATVSGAVISGGLGQPFIVQTAPGSP